MNNTNSKTKGKSSSIVLPNATIINGSTNAIFTYVKTRAANGRAPDVPVVITGPIGSGKTAMARTLHCYVYGENYKEHFFVRQNCTGLESNIVMSQLFGHIKGAFTGASTVKKGLLDATSNGTLFLDDMDCLPVQVQTMLFSIIDKGHYYYPLGAEGDITQRKQFNGLMIFATNREFKELFEKAAIRADFYSRISLIEIKIQPLAANKIELARVLKQYWEEERKGFADIAVAPQFTEAGWNMLINADYPANYRDARRYIAKSIIALLSKPAGYRISENEVLSIIKENDNSFYAVNSRAARMNSSDIFVKLADAVISDPFITRRAAADIVGFDYNAIQRFMRKHIHNRLSEKPDVLNHDEWNALKQWARNRRLN